MYMDDRTSVAIARGDYEVEDSAKSCVLLRRQSQWAVRVRCWDYDAEICRDCAAGPGSNACDTCMAGSWWADIDRRSLETVF